MSSRYGKATIYEFGTVFCTIHHLKTLSPYTKSSVLKSGQNDEKEYNIVYEKGWGSGGIGRRVGLRIRWDNPWGFESPLPHQEYTSMVHEKSMIYGTTVLCVRRHGRVAMAGDGQITFQAMQLKGTARKIRRLYHNQILAGFAGSAADAFSLFERFESKLEAFQGNMIRSAVELSRDWRTDKILRRLEALLIVANMDTMLLLSGTGDVIEPDEPILAIGSGAPYALSAATALYSETNLSARDIAEKSLQIASKYCIYTNSNITVECLPDEEES